MRNLLISAALAFAIGCGSSQIQRPTAPSNIQVPTVATMDEEQDACAGAEQQVTKVTIRLNNRIAEVSFDPPANLVLEECRDNNPEAFRQYECLYRLEGNSRSVAYRYDQEAYVKISYTHATKPNRGD